MAQEVKLGLGALLMQGDRYMEHHASSDIGLPRKPMPHPFTRLRLDRHRELHPDHRDRDCTGVTDREATVVCDCGAVFETTPEDEAAYREVTELLAKVADQRDIARKHAREARRLEAKAKRLAESYGP